MITLKIFHFLKLFNLTFILPNLLRKFNFLLLLNKYLVIHVMLYILFYLFESLMLSLIATLNLKELIVFCLKEVNCYHFLSNIMNFESIGLLDQYISIFYLHLTFIKQYQYFFIYNKFINLSYLSKITILIN